MPVKALLQPTTFWLLLLSAFSATLYGWLFSCRQYKQATHVDGRWTDFAPALAAPSISLLIVAFAVLWQASHPNSPPLPRNVAVPLLWLGFFSSFLGLIFAAVFGRGRLRILVGFSSLVMAFVFSVWIAAGIAV